MIAQESPSVTADEKIADLIREARGYSRIQSEQLHTFFRFAEEDFKTHLIKIVAMMEAKTSLSATVWQLLEVEDELHQGYVLTAAESVKTAPSFSQNLRAIFEVSNASTGYISSLMRGLKGVNSTAQRRILPEVIEEFESMFAAARYEIFEYGMDSQFSITLGQLVRRFDVAIEILTDFIIGKKVNSTVASETLYQLGNIEHLPSHRDRLWLLERSLDSDSPRVRDGAILGLASLDDPSAISYLEAAVQREKIPELKQDMLQVLDQLQKTKMEMRH